MWLTMVAFSTQKPTSMQIFRNLDTTFHCMIIATTISKNTWFG